MSKLYKNILRRLYKDCSSISIIKIVEKYSVEEVNKAMDWASNDERIFIAPGRFRINPQTHELEEYFPPDVKDDAQVRKGNLIGVNVAFRIERANNPWIATSKNPFKFDVDRLLLSNSQRIVDKILNGFCEAIGQQLFMFVFGGLLSGVGVWWWFTQHVIPNLNGK